MAYSNDPHGDSEKRTRRVSVFPLGERRRTQEQLAVAVVVSKSEAVRVSSRKGSRLNSMKISVFLWSNCNTLPMATMKDQNWQGPVERLHPTRPGHQDGATDIACAAMWSDNSTEIQNISLQVKITRDGSTAMNEFLLPNCEGARVF